MAERTVSIVIEVDGAREAVGQMRQMRSALDELGGGAKSLERLLRQGREMTQVMKQMGGTLDLRSRQKELAAGLEDFFRRITTGARGAADIFKNIWREVTDYFERQMRQMAAAAAAGFGGLGATGFAALAGLPATMPLGDVLSRMALRGIGPFSGGQTALGGLGLFGMAMGANSPVWRGLGSIAGGALTGFSVGGPVGAVIGGLIGGIASLFGKDRKKEHDAAVANQGFAQLRQILDDYNHFRRDFASAVDAANRVWTQMAGQWVRPQSAPSQRPYFDAILRSLQATEDERNRRRQMLALLPVPEFQSGGLVTREARRGGRIPAFLHEGEFVMNRAAVERWGVAVLDGLNRGTGWSARDAGLSVAIDPDGARWLEQNADALERGIAVILRKGGKVSRALRG